MGFKVDDEYYTNVCEYYKNQIAMVETCLEEFKAACDGLFADNYYGDNIQRILTVRANNFYYATASKLTSLIDETSVITETFLDNIDRDDNLF